MADTAPAPEGVGAVPTEEAPAAAAGDASADVAPAADPPAGADAPPAAEATPAAEAPATTEADPASAAEDDLAAAAAAADATPSAEAPAAAEAAPAAEAPAAAEGAPEAESPSAVEVAPAADAPAVVTGDEAGEAAAKEAAEPPASAADAPQEAPGTEVAGDGAATAAGADKEAPATQSADLKASPSTTELADGYAGDPAASPEAPFGEDTTSSPREDAGDAGILESTETVKVEVPDMRVDINGPERPKSGILQAQEKLCSAVDGAMAEFGGSFQSEDPEVQTALLDWKARLESHVAELQSIMGQQPQLAGETTMSLPSPEQEEAAQVAAKEHEETLSDEVNTVRSIAHELESQRTGRDVEEVASAWADPEETNKEVAELRRVRRQIRYLFGGMIGSLPEATTLRVDDLLSDRDAYSGPESPVLAPQRPPRPQGDIERGTSDIPKAKMAEVGYQRAANSAAILAPEAPYPGMPSPRQSRPRSGGTESVDTATNSSVATWNSQSRRDGDPEEQRRRAERREQRQQHRNRKRDHRSDAPREMKKDDGAVPMPSKQWNWAEEVVKASLDPGNQWEFPGIDDGRGAAARGPQWEQPRQRAADVVVKTRERAEEVMRSERDRKPNPYGMEVAAYR